MWTAEASLRSEFRHWPLASYAKKQRPYDDITGHLKVEKSPHPFFLPGRVLPTFQKLQKWQNLRRSCMSHKSGCYNSFASLSLSKVNGRVTEMVATYDRILSSEPRPSSPGLVPYSNREHSPPCLFSRPTSPYSASRGISFFKARS